MNKVKLSGIVLAMSVAALALTPAISVAHGGMGKMTDCMGVCKADHCKDKSGNDKGVRMSKQACMDIGGTEKSKDMMNNNTSTTNSTNNTSNTSTTTTNQ